MSNLSVNGSSHTAKGFTLSELLVSLAILGLISAFAIPKVLSAVGDGATKAIIKEAFSTISEAYQSVKLDNNGAFTNLTIIQAGKLLQKVNFESSADNATFSRTGTVGLADAQGFTSWPAAPNACVLPGAPGTSSVCSVRLQNGAIITTNLGDRLGGLVTNDPIPTAAAGTTPVTIAAPYGGIPWNGNTFVVGDPVGTKQAALNAGWANYIKTITTYGRAWFTIDPDGPGANDRLTVAIGGDGRIWSGAQGGNVPFSYYAVSSVADTELTAATATAAGRDALDPTYYTL